MSLSTNTTYRVLVEKLGASDSSQFIGNEGEVFYDPSIPTLKLSDGSTPGGVSIGGTGGGGGGGESYWVSTAAGIHTLSNVGIGTTNPTSKLTVVGDAFYTGIVTAGFFVGDGSGLTNLPGGDGFSGDYNDLINIIGSSGPQNVAIGFDVHSSFTYTLGQGVVAIGAYAGNTNQGGLTVAIGWAAAMFNQGVNAVAVGYAAGQDSQEDGAVAIGAFAGNQFQGAHSIAIGKYAGYQETGVAQPDNTIFLNATGLAQEVPAQTNRFYVKPVRAVNGASLPEGFKPVAYNPTTGEFIYYDA